MIRVDYAGPGGTCEGLRMVGLGDRAVGIEWDAAACATRAAAGHLTIRADLATYRPHHAPGSVEGYWASPPCQTFSSAGKGDGRDQLDALGLAILGEDWAAADGFDSRTRHVLDAARTAVELHPEWIGMEQVPAVLPLWRALAHVLERHGYSTWAGVLCAADYGVPQTRRRAILMASRVRCVQPPTPTHAETPGLFGELPWVSMADALGWGFEREPAGTVCANSSAFADSGYRERLRSYVLDRRQTGAPVAGCWRLPATTVAGDPRITARCHHDEGSQGANAVSIAEVAAGVDPEDRPIRLTVADASTLQSFPADYPWQGTKSKQFEQIGNAVPPLMAAHVVAALTGSEVVPS